MSDIMLKVNDINVYYGSIHAIKDISFEVRKATDSYACRRGTARAKHNASNDFRPSSFKDRFDRVPRQKPLRASLPTR